MARTKSALPPTWTSMSVYSGRRQKVRVKCLTTQIRVVRYIYSEKEQERETCWRRRSWRGLGPCRCTPSLRTTPATHSHTLSHRLSLSCSASHSLALSLSHIRPSPTPSVSLPPPPHMPSRARISGPLTFKLLNCRRKGLQGPVLRVIKNNTLPAKAGGV